MRVCPACSVVREFARAANCPDRLRRRCTKVRDEGRTLEDNRVMRLARLARFLCELRQPEGATLLGYGRAEYDTSGVPPLESLQASLQAV